MNVFITIDYVVSLFQQFIIYKVSYSIVIITIRYYYGFIFSYVEKGS